MPSTFVIVSPAARSVFAAAVPESTEPTTAPLAPLDSVEMRDAEEGGEADRDLGGVVARDDLLRDAQSRCRSGSRSR